VANKVLSLSLLVSHIRRTCSDCDMLRRLIDCRIIIVIIIIIIMIIMRPCHHTTTVVPDNVCVSDTAADSGCGGGGSGGGIGCPGNTLSMTTGSTP